MPLSAGDKLGPYEIVTSIGVGGMGEVYRATDAKLGRDVALKVLPPAMAHDPERLQRFHREARSVAALNHPNVVTIYSVEQSEGIHFLTMELVEGQTLDRLIPAEGFAAERIIEMAAALADALGAAHDKGLVHRDLKPANIMVTHDGRIKVLDFGLAKVLGTAAPTQATVTSVGETQVGTVMGTPAYMSPEQISGRTLDHRTDIFSLGIVLYEITTGRRPFEGDTPGELAAAILRDHPPPVTDRRVDVPFELADLIDQCLAKDATARIQTARLLGKGLQAAALQLSSGASRTQRVPTGEGAGFWVAVLPFRYRGGNADIETLAEGLAEEIIGGLSRFSYLRVIARGSTLKYTQETADVRAAGKELGARYVLEGSLRQAGAKLRIAVQLVDAVTCVPMWAETYERVLNAEAIFELQDDLVPRIVSTIADHDGVLPQSMAEALRSKSEDQLSPHEALLRTFRFFKSFTPDERATAKRVLERAVRNAPERGDCWAMLSHMYSNDYWEVDGLPESLERALAAARRAVDVAPSNHLSYWALALALFLKRDIPAFRLAAERAIDLNRMDGSTVAFMGHLMAYAGDWERGCAIAELASALNPNHAAWHRLAAFYNAYRKGEFQEALAAVLRLNMPHFQDPAGRAAVYGQLGERDAAQKAVQELLALKPDFASVARDYYFRWQRPELVEPLMEGWRKAGLEIRKSAAAAVSPSGKIPSDEGFWVAVLPFKYRGQDASLEALAEGISEGIVTGLSRFSYLRVVARASTLKYSSEVGDVRTISKELGARYVMEGSIRQAGVNCRVAVQLVDAVSGAHLWAETFDRAFRPDEIFALQDQLVPRIVATVADQHGVLCHSMSNLIRNKSDEQLTPLDAVLRVFSFHERMSPQEHARVRSILERMVERAPDEGDCWAMLATVYSDEYMFGFSGEPDPLERARVAARRAVEIRPSSPLACQALAQNLFYRRELEAFRPVAERTIALNPMDGATGAYVGMLIALSGDWERGCAVVNAAMQLNPSFPGWYWLALVFNAYRQRDYRASANLALRINMPGYFWGPATSAAAWGQLGERESAQKALRELLSIRPDFGASAREEFGKWFDDELVKHYIEGLRKAGLDIGSGKTAAVNLSSEVRADEGFWVAVLPFKSGGASAEVAALAEGLSDEIVTGLSRFSYLRVIARGSTLKYVNQAADLRTVGQELGARYVMEGSLRLAGAKLRVAVQLVDAATGAQMWAETYERAFHPEAIFEVQDDLVPRIVSTVADHEGVLPQSMAEVLRSKSEDQLSPHEAMLRSFRFFKTLNMEEHAVAKRILEKAVHTAPDHGDCWALLSHMYSNDYWHARVANSESLEHALAAGRRAVDVAPSHNLSHWALALALYLKRDFPACRLAAERAIELNRMDGSAVAFMGGLIAQSGEWERGSSIADPASALNPNHAGWHRLQASLIAYQKGDYRSALAAALRANMPDNYQDPAVRAAAYGQLGERELAQKAIQELLALEPDFVSTAREFYGRWQSPEVVEHLVEGWRKAGLEIEGAAPDPGGDPSGETRAAEGFWVAVLPFKSAGTSAELAALAEGLSEEIVTGLSRFSYLRVIGRGSTLRYANQTTDLRRVGKELGARYVMEGSLRQAGANLRIAVQLVETTTGAHLWAETYDRPFRPDELFKVQDDLVPRIVSTVADQQGILPQSMSEALRSKGTKLTPHEAVLRAFSYFERITPEEHAEVRQILEEAAENAPGQSDCQAMLSIMYWHEHAHEFNVRPDPLGRAVAAARRAIKAAPANHTAHYALAASLFFQKDLNAFRPVAEHAIALNRMAGATTAFIGILIAYSGDWERGCAIVEQASELNPHHPGWYHFAAFFNAYRKGEYRAAADVAFKINMPGYFYTLVAQAAALGQLGEVEPARKAFKELLALRPDIVTAAREIFSKWYDPELVERLIEGLRKAGLDIEVTGDAAVSPTGETRADQGFWVAVLPFKSTGPEVAALADGLSEEIVTGLSRFSYLRVIARGSTLKYAGQAFDLRTVGKELGARYVMEGSVRQAGAKLRVAVQLVDALTGAQLWAETYERAFAAGAIFELQDDLVPRIVSTVADQNGVLPHSMSAVVRTKNAEQLSPYEAVLRTFSYFERLTPEEHAEVRRILEAAVRDAPGQSDCWAMLSMLYRGEYSLGFNAQPNSLARALAAAHRAIETAPSNHLGHYALAATLFSQKNLHEFRSAAEHAMALNPMDGSSLAFLGMMIAFAGDWDHGCAMVERARQLNPHHAGWYNFAACFNAYNKGEYRAALDAAYKIKMMGYYLTFVARAAALGQLGEQEPARTAVNELIALRPSITKSAREDLGKWLGAELVEHVIEGLRKAGLEIEGAAASARSASGGLRADEGFWVAVLPFKSAGASSEVAALADGLSEEIVTGLSRFSYLRVIGRGSTLRYANQTTDLRTVGKEVGAHYVMEGSLRLAGAKLRVAVQLVDALTGAQLWAETYERGFSAESIFELQDDLVPRIVSTVADQHGVLVHSMSAVVRKKHSGELSPYEAVLRAFGHFERLTPEEHAEVRAILETAVRDAPNESDCWAVLSTVYRQEYAQGFNPQPDSLDRAYAAARRAIELAPSNHLGHYALASALYFQKDLPGFRPVAEHAMALNPMDASTLAFMGLLIAYSGDWEHGGALVERGRQLNPYHPGWYHFAAFFNAYHKGEYRAALDAAYKIKTMGGYYLTFVKRAAAHGQLGELEPARKAVKELLALRPDIAKTARVEFSKWYSPELVEHLIDGLRKAGLDIASEPQAVQAAPAQAAGTSIAVLPFANLSADPEQEYFSDGLAEEIINMLAHIPGLRVIARTSAFAFKGQNSDIRHIAETLGVAHVLEGSVRRSGNRIRVTAQMIAARDGSHLWSERFDREMADVFVVQDEIAAAIAKALHIKLSAQPAALRKYTPTAPAYDAMMRARHYFNKLTPEAMERGQRCLKEAIALDPGYALAYSELGVHIATFAAVGTRPAHEVIPSARAEVQKALEIDPTLPEALAALGRITALYDYDWAEGERLFRMALEQTPASPTARKLYSLYLLALGEPKRAIGELSLALREDPLDFYFRLMLALAYLHVGDTAAAIAECRAVLEFDEQAYMANLVLIFVYLELGDADEALRQAEIAHVSGVFHWAVSGCLAGLLKHRGDTERTSAILQTMGDGTAYGAPSGLLCYHLICGEIDQAADWAGKAIEQRQPSIVLYMQLPFARELRESPRWAGLARLMKFPDRVS